MVKDLGVVQSLAGAAILSASYVASGVVNGGRPRQIRWTLKAVAKHGTALTGVNMKISASKDGAVYLDIKSQDDTDPVVGAADIVHNVAIAQDQTKSMSLTTDGSFPYLTVSLQATGGDGAAGDLLEVQAEATW